MGPKSSVSTEIKAENLWIPLVPQSDGVKVRIRRRPRTRHGLVLGPAQPIEIERIKEQHPDIAKKLGL